MKSNRQSRGSAGQIGWWLKSGEKIETHGKTTGVEKRMKFQDLLL